MNRLLALRGALPGANVSALVARHPQVLQQSCEQIQAAADLASPSRRRPAAQLRPAAPGAPPGWLLRPQGHCGILQPAGSCTRAARCLLRAPPIAAGARRPHRSRRPRCLVPRPQAHELLAELGDGEVDGLLEAAPYLLDAALLPAVLQDLAATFPGMGAPFMLQQHVKLGSVHLQRYRAGSV
jgi:hypothetical protein